MKNELRKKYLAIRKNIINASTKSKIIQDNVINTKYYQDSKVIALYKSMTDEVNTEYLI